MEVTLRLGMLKFGGTLSLYGSKEFQRKEVAVAAERGVVYRFDNPALEVLHGELIEKRRGVVTNLPKPENPFPAQMPVKVATKNISR